LATDKFCVRLKRPVDWNANTLAKAKRRRVTSLVVQ
jgi:hypothetical protein